MNQTRTDIKAMFADLKGLSPAKFSRLIDALWRDYLQLYAENKLAYPDLHLIDDTDPDYDDRYLYVRNNFTNGEGELVNSWSTAQGYGHQILADFAQVFGFFNYALSQFETVMGSFAQLPDMVNDPQLAKGWQDTDRHFTLGNGKDDSDRSNALIIYKSGLVEWFNAQVFGKYKHENDGVPVLPKDGTLQFTPENDFEYWKNGQWNSLKGADGENGLSAYEIALENGYEGTELEWLESLHGADGEDGEPGADAPDKYYTLTDTPAAPPTTPERGFAILTQAGEVQKHTHATALGQDSDGAWVGTTSGETWEAVTGELVEVENYDPSYSYVTVIGQDYKIICEGSDTLDPTREIQIYINSVYAFTCLCDLVPVEHTFTADSTTTVVSTVIEVGGAAAWAFDLFHKKIVGAEGLRFVNSQFADVANLKAYENEIGTKVLELTEAIELIANTFRGKKVILKNTDAYGYPSIKIEAGGMVTSNFEIAFLQNEIYLNIDGVTIFSVEPDRFNLTTPLYYKEDAPSMPDLIDILPLRKTLLNEGTIGHALRLVDDGDGGKTIAFEALGTMSDFNHWQGTQAEYDANTEKNGILPQAANTIAMIPKTT